MEKVSSGLDKFMLLALILVLSSAVTLDASANAEEVNALESLKACFSNSIDVLPDWNNANGDHCSWHGVYCNNATFNVVTLNLSNLNIVGEISPAIGDLKYLEYIDFKGNHLSGQIPDEIGNCVSLKYLDLSANSLYGDIPFSISKLKQLEELILKYNQLSGPIPSTLSQIPNLKVLDLAQNQLTGEIPRLLYWNEVLQYLGLRGNALTGTLSPDMCQLTGLWYFDVRGNNLTGTIPENIGNCTSFEILDISYNQISGEIPYNIGFLQVATLSLQGNKLSGKIPEVIGLMQALAVLDLSENELVGPLPPILGNLSYTGKLYLHSNKLTGPIPPEFGNMTKLSYLQLNNNQLVGSIPSELGKLVDLFELNLANNNLEGPIPENISSCTALNQFNVHGNSLNQSIPLKFEKLGSLTYLNLSSNKFSGRIPVQLGRIINLDTLDLSDNEFSGKIPASIGGLEHLLQLNLSKNHLRGPIPPEFGNLRSVQVVDLSKNNLEGVIPSEIGQLQNIASLILSNNSFQGEIPPQITNCFSLVNLNVSYNNLSGMVPLAKNFSRFPPESFLGNPFLCGSWLGAGCGFYGQPSKAIISRAAVVCITLGCITLLSMVVVAIYRSKQPQQFAKGSDTAVQGPPKLVILHMNMAIHTYEDIMRITENLNEKYIIGYGATSTVYKCILKNSKPIAIKRLYSRYPHNLREFENELATIGSIKHRNLVCLHGYSLTPHGNLLFYDYMENGSLWDLLHGPSRKVKLDWDTRLRIAVGAAQGLAYLHHDCDPRIIHRDVKTSNILLDENFEAHLSDFGIAKCISSTKTHSSTYVMGTIGYIDPEYARTSRLNEKSDVYSFGIVLLELLTGKKAVDDESNLHQLILSKADDNTVMEAVDSEVSVTCTDMRLVRKMFQLALLCTRRHPCERPAMHEVARVLVSLLPVSSTKSVSSMNYERYMDEYSEEKLHETVAATGSENCSDAQWFLRFGEVISKNAF
ncbi:LRR receptor-like serine/threonine-protein kinase SIK1 [Nymphaea colorata]|nr:LRR receptor-like serine/threonine-protein kinase SIK1 [Nymphaea colorata]XP_031494121.1 LRR receptor-like serine/threonine-protein kinase SIK1 [Nymphaea colorata]XP_031494122.1 LRR receptor-like serine/threonine-protein kinase SIK1 [Nymphaea colorata]XP_031494123.1 LRR receptor-like serine/threonine-protein kinase SIK1 [Nymphaea colorata]